MVLKNFFQFSIRADGSIRLKHIVQPNGVLPQWLMRMGLTMSLSKALQKSEMVRKGT